MTKAVEYPSSELLERELARTRYQERYHWMLGNTFFTLITVAAIAVLIAALVLPVLQIYGTSMSPELAQGDIVLAVKTTDFEQGDVIAFYYNNKILVKRVIGTSGDQVSLDERGNVSVNGTVLVEDYVTQKDMGDTDLDYPYEVPEDRIFVLGDNRSISVDSRIASLGCVSEEQIIGRVFFRIWPIADIGLVK